MLDSNFFSLFSKPIIFDNFQKNIMRNLVNLKTKTIEKTYLKIVLHCVFVLVLYS
jgi:hypothetical protein